MVDSNRAFTIGPELAKLTGPYPPPEDVLEAASAGQREKAILARLWVSEGIPFAFRRCPGLYEEVRNALATRLEIDAKEISVVGSGRIGYSLAPTKWGEPYEAVESDLDFFAVSEGLFERLREDFERWRDDYDCGEAEPTSARERYFWNMNREEAPERIRRGFIDSIRVPNWERYTVFSAMNGCLADLWAELQRADEGPKPQSRLTLRCYQDWPSYERQTTISLKAVVDRRAPAARRRRD